MSKKFAGSLHAHGCRRCATRYTDACHQPEDDTLCDGCRGLEPSHVLIASAGPHPCCLNNSRMVMNTAEKLSYRLAGGRIWFICKTCARTHPFDPRRSA